MSASADYGVAIAEDFAPPENWVPGQTIEKNVSVTNTGNIDAFVRSWIQGEMRVVKEDTTGVVLSKADSAVAATDENYIKLGFTKYTSDESGNKYLKTLSTQIVENPDDSANAANNSTNTKAYSEVMAMQAGGFLAYAPTAAEYKYTANQDTIVEHYDADTSNTDTSKTFKKDEVVEVVATATVGKVTAQTYDGSTTHFKGVEIDSDTFVPKTTGLYLFRRVIDQGAASDADKYEYSGYYYVAVTGDTGGQGTYYALQTGKKTTTGDNPDTNVSDYTVPTSQITVTKDTQSGLVSYITPTCKLMTVSETRVENSGLTWTYTAADASTGKAKMTATYNGGTTDTNDDDITIEVALVNVGKKTTGLVKDDNTDDTETWTAIGSGAATTFYYNNDLEAGDTTSRLIDSVKLADITTQKAYLAFDFDLNVFMESKQVTMDESDKEMVTPVKPWAATTDGAATNPANVNTGATVDSDTNYAKAYTDTTEISVIGWKVIS